MKLKLSDMEVDWPEESKTPDTERRTHDMDLIEMRKRAILALKDAAIEQKAHDGEIQNCPECGQPYIKARLYTNSTSRLTDDGLSIQVCDGCGRSEATARMAGRSLRPESWAAARPGFSVVPGRSVQSPMGSREMAASLACAVTILERAAFTGTVDEAAEVAGALDRIRRVEAALLDDPRGSTGSPNGKPST